MRQEKLSKRVINDFGDEWSRFRFLGTSSETFLAQQVNLYLTPIKHVLEPNNQMEIADFGAGSGRWSEFLLPHASTLWVVEPSLGAFAVLKERFQGKNNVVLLNQRIEDCAVVNSSLDLAVSLGVIHHIPDPLMAVKQIHSKLKIGGHFLCYLYYDFENRKRLYRLLWKTTDFLRQVISRLPKRAKFLICDIIALFVYFPLAKLSKIFEVLELESRNVPLSHYRNLPFVMMRNDALDRFGTRLERRYSRNQIKSLFEEAGFDSNKIKFSEGEPFWTFLVEKS